MITKLTCAERTCQTENVSKATSDLRRNRSNGSPGEESQKRGICSHARKGERMKMAASAKTIQSCHHCSEQIPMSRDELTDGNGPHLPEFQTFLSNPPTKSQELHAKTLKGIEDIRGCHNSLNRGRPKDALERVTNTPEGFPSKRNSKGRNGS